MPYGYVRLRCYAPPLRVGDPKYNAEMIVRAVRQAETDGVTVAAFPELCVTGYTCGDLFLQTALIDGAKQAIARIASATADTGVLFFVGAPLVFGGKLLNCAVALCGGKALGVVPKCHIPNYGEFYEQRHFTSGIGASGEIALAGAAVPFGASLVFEAVNVPGLKVAAEICEDLWVACPPSSVAAQCGATVVVNLSASDETVGKADWRRKLVESQSGRCACAYMYADAGSDESTGDLVFAAHQLIAENGTIVAESAPFADGVATADVDLEKLLFERRRMNTFTACDSRTVPFTAAVAESKPQLSRTPFVPSDETERRARAQSILDMQAFALKKRLAHTGCGAVIGVSGGLDSALALLVTARAYALLKRKPQEIVAVSMPGLGTGERTRKNAAALIEAVGATGREIDISAAVKAHFADIGHDERVTDVVYENAQARERTQILMDIANGCNALVIGTGDLSELALGWETYNGDQMSMYGVNASVPKTLVKYLIAAEADRVPKLKKVLTDILNTEISPELIPAKAGKMQSTEDKIGKYELNDFFLYYVVRYGFAPKKVLWLARCAFPEIDAEPLRRTLKNFYSRFFSQQFKRSAMPDGVKVGSVSLSPRGDWRMPSDAQADLWLAELDNL